MLPHKFDAELPVPQESTPQNRGSFLLSFGLHVVALLLLFYAQAWTQPGITALGGEGTISVSLVQLSPGVGEGAARIAATADSAVASPAEPAPAQIEPAQPEPAHKPEDAQKPKAEPQAVPIAVKPSSPKKKKEEPRQPKPSAQPKSSKPSTPSRESKTSAASPESQRAVAHKNATSAEANSPAASGLATGGSTSTGTVPSTHVAAWNTGEGPRFVHQAPLRYPRMAQRRNQEGKATVEAHLDAKGALLRATVVQADSEDFGKAALDCVQTSTFAPATAQGRAVACVVRIPMLFVLKE